MGKWGLVFFIAFGLWACEEEKEQVEVPVIMKSYYQEPSFTIFDSVTIHNINSFFERHVSNGTFNGNVLFYKAGKKYSTSFGVSNYIEKTPLTEDNVFQLASGSKPVTAIAILQLIEQGKLNLTDTVSNIIDGFPYHKITVEMLLSHRSGLSNYMYITDSMWVDQDIPMCNANMLDSFILHQPDPYYPADWKFNYSNTNYFLLAAIAEKITGQEFGALLDQNVFGPAHMDHSLVYSNMDMRSIPNLAVGSENRKWHIPDYYLNGITGDKGVYSTTQDMLKLHLALQEGSILSDSVILDMYQPRSDFNYKNGSYALGWRIVKERENYPRIVYHLGWWRGYRSYFIRIPEQDIAIVLLSNLARGKFLAKDELLDLILDS